MTLTDLYWLLGLGAAFIALERLAPHAEGQRLLRDGWRADLMHLVISGPVIRLALIGIAVAASAMGAHLVPSAWAEAIRAQPDWVEYLEILLIAELGIYGAHRAAHAVPVLWRLHAVHHSSTELDWAVTYRVHPLEQLLFAGPALAVVIALGFSPEPLIAYGLIYRVHAILLHANVRFDFGPLKHLIGSPRFHHWHHADQREAYDQNFAAQLSVLDHLFGTFRLPRSGHPERYGVSDPVPDDYAGQLLYPFRGGARAQPVAPVSAPVQSSP